MQTFLHNKIEMAKTNRKYTDRGEVIPYSFTWYHSGVVGRDGIPSPQPPRGASNATCERLFKEWVGG